MPDRDVVERARYAIEWGNSDQLHRDLLAELERLRAQLDDSTASRIHRQWTNTRQQVKELRAELERLRQQRTITDVADLDALPNRSVIRAANGDYFEKSSRGGWDCLSEDGTGGLYVEIDLPAIVLWLPEWGNA